MSSSGAPSAHAVCALIVNYNRPRETIACVRSLRQCGYPLLRILVLDNGSTDSSFDDLRSAYPDLEIVQTGKNLGFSGANNFGAALLRENSPEFLLLLNNDTEVEPGFLVRLLAAADADGQAGAFVGTICYFAEKERIWYGGGDFIFWRGSGFSRDRGLRFSDLKTRETSEVTFATGCALLVRTTALAEMTLFDDRFFMYLEDADLSLRLRAAGYKVLYVPSSRVYHKVHHAGDKSLPLYYSTRNRLLVLHLHFRGWRRLLGMGYVLISTGMKSIVWCFRRRDLFRAALFGVQDYFASRFREGRGLALPAK